MANGVYGTNIPTLITNNDISKYVEIYYSYSPTRSSSDVNNSNFQKLDSENLRTAVANIDTQNTATMDDIVDGLYNLNLPSSIFGKKGYYTIYIKPREIPATIVDTSVLKDFPNIRGIVVRASDFPNDFQNEVLVNNSLVGYRVIYRNGDNSRSNEIRIVTSNNKCEPITSSSSNSEKNYGYRYNENANLSFLTLTPSTALSYKANSTPFIGRTSQQIYLVNTLFEPVCVELEVTEHDTDSIAEILTGSQLRDLNNGLITTFNSNGDIILQHEMSTLKETETGTPQFEVKENRANNIDFSQTLNDKID